MKASYSPSTMSSSSSSSLRRFTAPTHTHTPWTRHNPHDQHSIDARHRGIERGSCAPFFFLGRDFSAVTFSVASAFKVRTTSLTSSLEADVSSCRTSSLTKIW